MISLKSLLIPSVIVVALLAGIGSYIGVIGLLTVLLLSVLEITLSFDNAVVNAKVLSTMSQEWRQRFLTWGMIFAVFFSRLALPIIIVSVATALNPFTVAWYALFEGARYSQELEGASHSIAAFGGMFLLLVGLSYFFDSHKERHWIGFIERRFAAWGSIEAIEVGISLAVLLGIGIFLAEPRSVLIAGLLGVFVFIGVRSVAALFAITEGNRRGGFGQFLYLNVLDTAFSLDSVVGAFALTSNLVVVMVGLGIGAYAVRLLTIKMVHADTLSSLRYIEHGAHWAILGLSCAMLTTLFVHVPEPITGLIGLLFVGSAYISSVRMRNSV